MLQHPPKTRKKIEIFDAIINAINTVPTRTNSFLPPGGNGAGGRPIPLPANQADLKEGQLYTTNEGPAIWDGTQFNRV